MVHCGPGKGMVMVSPGLKPQSCWEFEGEILVLHHPTTISTRYQAMVHCGSIRQTASIIKMSSECLRTGDKASVLFRYVKHPEYLKEGQRLVFREGRTKAVGNVTKIHPHTPAGQLNTKAKTNKITQQQQGRGEGKRRPAVPVTAATSTQFTSSSTAVTSSFSSTSTAVTTPVTPV